MARSHRYQKGGPLKQHGGLPSYRLDVQAERFTPSEARAEYARLRREANRRLEVLGRSEFANIPSVASRDIYEALPKNATEQQVRRALYDVARFLNLKTSSLKGIRKTTRESLEAIRSKTDKEGKQLFPFVNESNILQFQKFMGAVQKHKEAKGYDSEQYGELFKYAKNKNIDPETLAEDFEFWLKHENELKKAPRSKELTTSEDIAKRIGLKID